jgi:uncharacterized protein (TIGR02246 family)
MNAMKWSLVTGVVMMCLLFRVGAAQSQASADDEALAVARRVVSNLETAWNTGNGKAYAAEYWPDAELINIFGSVVEGQTQVSARMSEIFAGAFKGSHVTSTIRKVRRLGPSVIVVDTDQDNTGTVGPQASSERQPVRTRLKNILERRNGLWRIVATQNTQVAAPMF